MYSLISILEISEMNQRLALSVVAASSCGLLFGYDIGAISSATLGLRAQFMLSPFALGVAMSSALFGTILGSISAGFIADSIDRRKTLFLSAFLYCLASFGTAFASSFIQFAAFRFGCGVAIGLISVASPLYLAEIAPSHWRGRVGGSFQFNVSVGVVLAFGLGFAFSNHFALGVAWRWSFVAGAVFALLCGTILWRASQSPRWLALKGRPAEVGTTLKALGSADPDADCARLAASLEEFRASQYSTLFSRQYARPILLAASIAIFNQLTGVNVLLYYILDVFSELGSGRLNGRRDAFLMAAFSLLVTTIAVGIIDKVGRKPLLLTGSAGMGACLLALPAIRYMGWPAESVVVILMCYNVFFGFSQGAVVWVYLSELFPLPVRARGQSFGSSVHWVANAIIIGSFPAIARSLGGKAFAGLAAMMVIQFFVILFVYPETKRASLESLASRIGN
jgi:sugar porter (SP) family MFS transporter